eukprot:TRINITY_DN1086_c0_g1_i1.p1 TRINITY_DN1086_c0_g1~~TRINITY_DN1086_c0_g1_i1.p1  ORF type:complete len:777 (+),score=195.33 TRINITY_DN1086_c0_g1_i1:63-2333(+)
MEGYMYIKGALRVKKYYFKINKKKNTLDRFKSKNTLKAGKSFKIHHKDTVRKGKVESNKYVFYHERYSNSTITFYCQKRSERKKWISALKEFIQTKKLKSKPKSKSDVHGRSGLNLDSLNDGAVIADKECYITSVNKELCKMTGYTKEELVGKNVTILMPSVIAHSHAGYVNTYLNTGNRRLIGKPRKLSIMKKDKTTIEAIIIINELNQGFKNYFFATFSEAKAQGEGNKDMFDLVGIDINSMNECCIVTNESAIILAVNNQVTEKLEYTSTDLLYQNVDILMPAAIAKHHDQYVARYVAEKDTRLIGRSRSVIVKHKNGSLYPIKLMLGEIFKDGKRYFLGSFYFESEEAIKDNSEDDDSFDTFSESDDFFTSADDSSSLDLSIKSVSDTNLYAKESSCPFTKTSRKLNKNNSSIKSDFNKTTLIENDTMGINKTFNHLLEQINMLTQENQALKQNSNNQNATYNSTTKTISINLDLKHLMINERLGCGGSGSIINSCNIDGWNCAMKEINIKHSTPQEIRGFEQEINLLETLPYHPNICRYLFHEKNSSSLRLFMTKYNCSLKSYLQQIKSENKKLTKDQIFSYSLSILKGISFLHTNNIIHRDLKSDNVFILLNDRGNDISCLAIGDFDQSTRNLNPSTLVGTPGYIAPEMFNDNNNNNNNNNNKDGYKKSIDIWSFGIILYELATLSRPYSNIPLKSFHKEIQKGPPELPEEIINIYPEIVSIFEKCCVIDPSKRLNARQLISEIHKFQTM